MEEIQYVVDRFGAKEIYFDDDIFTFSKERIYKLCELFHKSSLQIVWSCTSRVDLVDKPLLKAMAKAGCVAIKYEVESSSQEVLNNCKKKLSLDHIKKAFAWTKESGIKIHATFMFGLPGETLQSMLNTIKLAKELDPYTAQFAIAIPYPGTRLFSQARENKWLLTEDFSKYDGSNCVMVPPSYSKEDLDLAFNARLSFYLRPKYVIRQFMRAGSLTKFLYLVRSYYPYIMKGIRYTLGAKKILN